MEPATIQGVAKKLGVHRRMVRQALASAIPPERKLPVRNKPEAGAGDGVHRRDFAVRISGRRASSGTRRIGSGSGFAKSNPRRAWRKRRCGATCGERKQELGLQRARRSCRRSMTGAARRRWIGTRPWRTSTASARGVCLRDAHRWPAAERFTWPIITPRSRHFWKRMSWRFATSVASSGCCATTT